jgi:hypothetical protein
VCYGAIFVEQVVEIVMRIHKNQLFRRVFDYFYQIALKGVGPPPTGAHTPKTFVQAFSQIEVAKKPIRAI